MYSCRQGRYSVMKHVNSTAASLQLEASSEQAAWPS